MDEGISDTKDSYDNSWNDDASGKNSARAGIGIPSSSNAKATALRAAEAAAGISGAAAGGQSSAKLAEQVQSTPDSKASGNGFRWTGGKSNSTGKSTRSKLNAKKALPLIAILLLLIVATGAISILGNSFQLFSLAAQIKLKDNKLSETIYTSTENDVAHRLESTDPADRLSDFMIQLFADYGFDYVEEPNADGTVARALIYQNNTDDATLIAASNVKDRLLDVLSTTGSAINRYSDLAAVSNGDDQTAAAWYGALSVVSAGAWYDESASLTYDRLGLNSGKFNGLSGDATDDEIVAAAKAGGASEDVNNNTGTTTRYVWTKHEYKYCDRWKPIYDEDGNIVGYKCGHYADGSVWDWDDVSSIQGKYTKYLKTSDPFPDTATAAETCTPWGPCRTFQEQSDAADPKPFTGDEIATRITSDDDQSAAQDALGKRAVLSAFSTYPGTNGSTQVAATKSDTSLISALSSMVKNKTTNFANNVLNATDKAKAGYGGSEMNYYGNLLNTPAESCDADGNNCTTIAATESSSFNSWFSDDIIVSADNPIVQKYNVANTLEGKGITNTAIDNSYTGNYNNMDNTIANTYTAENLSNSTDQNDKPYNYCQAASGSKANLCPFGNKTLNASDYTAHVTNDVATYAYSLTSIDLNSDPAGEEAMVAFNEGVSLLNDAMLKQSSGTYGDEATIAAFYRMEQTYLAKLANYERQTKSPLDISSSNTFLGSIVSSLLPYATATRNNALFSTIAATAQVIGSSVISLLPSAAADSLDELTYLNEQTTKDCIAYETSGMLCDIYGNPITVMDQTYMADKMEDIEQKMESWGYVEQGSCATKEGCKINENYNDANHPSYTDWLLCTQNDTVINNNLTTEKSSRTGNSGGIFQAILSFVKNLFNRDRDSVRNQTSCGGSYAGQSTEVATRHKVFAQFTLNQRVKTLQRYQEENTVTAYLRHYYEENPLDQSYEGIIARQAGLTVDEVEQLFAYMEYSTYLARYDSGARYQFVELQSDLELSLAQTDYDTMKVAAVIGKMQDFEELRARNFAA